MVSRTDLTDRTAWGKEARKRMGYRCMGCGKRKSALQIHEIERRGHAPGRWAHRCNYLLLCPTCHGWMFDCMPHAEQLAFKLYWDTHHYDLDSWLRLRDPELLAPHRIEISEVEEYLSILRNEFDGK